MPPHDIPIRKLRVFTTLAGTGNVRAAAEALFLTQSAVSRSLMALEAELGTPLFLRSSRVMLSAPQIGVRHTRRLVGTDTVLRSRWSDGTALPDEVAITPAVSPKFPNISIPYGALVPVQLDGLLA